MVKAAWSCAMVMLLGLNVGARATLLVNEPFEYAAGAVGGTNGGTGFVGAWVGDSTFSVVPGSLGVAGFQGTGNAAQFSANFYTSKAMTRSLNVAFGTTGTDLWVSYLTRPTSLNAYSGLDLGTTFQQSLSFGILGGPQGIGPPSAFWGMDTTGVWVRC